MAKSIGATVRTLVLLPQLLSKDSTLFYTQKALVLGYRTHLSSPGASLASALSLAQQSPGRRVAMSRPHPSCGWKSGPEHTTTDGDLEASSSSPRVSPQVSAPSQLRDTGVVEMKACRITQPPRHEGVALTSERS